MINRDMRHAIHEQRSRDELLAAVRASGFQPIVQNCRELVLNGTTTVEEVRRTIFTTD
jgi:type IV pilus assembly protein PilB